MINMQSIKSLNAMYLDRVFQLPDLSTLFDLALPRPRPLPLPLVKDLPDLSFDYLTALVSGWNRWKRSETHSGLSFPPCLPTFSVAGLGCFMMPVTEFEVVA